MSQSLQRPRSFMAWFQEGNILHEIPPPTSSQVASWDKSCSVAQDITIVNITTSQSSIDQVIKITETGITDPRAKSQPKVLPKLYDGWLDIDKFDDWEASMEQLLLTEPFEGWYNTAKTYLTGQAAKWYHQQQERRAVKGEPLHYAWPQLRDELRRRLWAAHGVNLGEDKSVKPAP